MANIDLMSMTKEELAPIKKDVEKAIKRLEDRHRAAALTAVEAKAQEMGITLAGLTGDKGKVKSVSAPKYAHPENPEMAWAGKGRRPARVVTYVEAGGEFEDLGI